MMKELPHFKTHRHAEVIDFVTQVFIRPNQPEISYFVRLIDHSDGHYGIVFDLSYFASAEAPTKSQWNSVKKKLKRHDKQIFVFKDYSVMPCNGSGTEKQCGYIEFGYFAQPEGKRPEV